MKYKILNLLLVITSLLGYLEWGKDNHILLFWGEVEIISKMFTSPSSVIHPFVLLPLAGQIVLLITLFQRKPSKILTFVGIGGVGVLLAFLFVIGLISMNYKILLSAVPFLITVFFTIKAHARKKQIPGPHTT